MTWPVYMATWKVKPHVEKLCDILGVTLEELFPLFFCKVREKKFENDDLFISEYTLKTAIDTEERYASIEVFQKLNDKQYKKLSKREKKILLMYFFNDATLQDIADVYSLSRDRIRQIMLNALRKMRWNKINLRNDWLETKEVYQ